VDVSGKTIIPGIIDAHAHGSQGVGFIPQQNWMAYATLALGVTTVHDPSNDATEVFAAAEMQRTGQILAPRIFSTGDILYGARSSYFAEIDSLDDARRHVRRLKAQGAMSVKNYNQPRREQRQQITTAAREENMLVVSEGGSLFHMDLSMVADGNSTIEHNLPQSMLYDDVLQFWGQTGVAYTPTLVVTFGGLTAEHYWYQETEVWKHPILSRFVPPQVLQPRSVRRIKAPDEDYQHISSATTARLLAEEGVLVSIGAHGQREGLASHWEIWSFAQGGMSAVEALRAATLTPARALGYASDLGSLEPGKLADLVVIDADVLADIYQSDRVSHVMLNGRLYEAETMNEVVTGERKTKPFFWQDSGR
jgi:imidazolonepropionase-like amidohydrolase